MNRLPKVTLALAIVGAGLVGCADGERDEYVEDLRSDLAEASDDAAAHLSEFRADVGEALYELRSDLRSSREELSAEAEEEWTELAAAADQTEDELMAELERLPSATEQEVLEIREAASRRVAVLEAELVRSRIHAAETVDEVSGEVKRRLDLIQDDLSYLGRQAELQERLGEVREEVAEAADASESEFERVRTELAESVAALTREVRARWYALEWKVDGRA